MKKTAFILIAITVAVSVFAQNSDDAVPTTLINNDYYQKSIICTQQAQAAYEDGDYDLSASYSEQAAEFAKLSDEYVVTRLADYSIQKAHSRYTWAKSVGAEKRYPAEWKDATTAYNEAVSARDAKNYSEATDAANRVLAALAGVRSASGEPAPPSRSPGGTLPAQYTVRTWKNSGDCFWNISSWSWVYGNGFDWDTLYQANKDKIPDPANPNLIEPGTVLDIPSIRGEKRSGMWDPAVNYSKKP